ncbi:hypothetical protein [Aeriscardovia aeriphila]|uniref:Carbon starvation protein n=1 Tax=Aeriscardovia aeriphila TaxID=218139 RepID=A0A261FC91_9BIFI|nr:hypothetical protein [Aeriscardovia aeriphila]NYI26222.1 cytoskeletal protein RodZ [Aeriscardovia aeriphila]OZG56767.1 hypothetical protein AEAE_0076 [Aeriscardovia aeriphila]
MQLNERARARLYALTALACVLWLGQSLYEANKDGSLTSWATWVFAACLLVVIGWTGYNAWVGLVKSADEESPVEEKGDEERSDEKKSDEESPDEEKGDAPDVEVSAGDSAQDSAQENA